MRAVNREAGLAMIEAPLLEPGRLRIPPQMILVAIDTLLHPHRVVISPVLVPKRSDLPMAGQALCAADLLPDLVALRAITRSFERRMGPGKLARRKLSARSAPCESNCKNSPANPLNGRSFSHDNNGMADFGLADHDFFKLAALRRDIGKLTLFLIY